MTTERKDYVTLRSCFVAEGQKEGNPVTYDTLEKAIEALDDLGLCVNWAILTTTKDHSLITLLYEGWAYRHSYESCVVLPFNVDTYGFENQFKALLEKIFQPFTGSFGNRGSIHRSLINVIPSKDFSKNECFFVTLLLLFSDEKGKEGEKARVIQEVLTKVEDGHDDVVGRFFCLD